MITVHNTSSLFNNFTKKFTTYKSYRKKVGLKWICVEINGNIKLKIYPIFREAMEEFGSYRKK
jgi:hypothetical protein